MEAALETSSLLDHFAQARRAVYTQASCRSQMCPDLFDQVGGHYVMPGLVNHYVSRLDRREGLGDQTHLVHLNYTEWESFPDNLDFV